MQFIFFNMCRALISHSYELVAKSLMIDLDKDELLKVKHWLVKL